MTENPVPGSYEGRTSVPAWSVPTRTGPVRRGQSSPFWQLVTLGLLTIGFGVAALIWPDASVRILAVLLGVWLLASGLARVVGAFLSGRSIPREVLSGIVGLVYLMAGAACLRDVANGVLVLALMIGLAWILSGVAEFVVALDAGGARRRWLTALAAVSVAIGFGFLVWPHPSLTVLVVLTGVSALAVGSAELVFAVQLRRATTRR